MTPPPGSIPQQQRGVVLICPSPLVISLSPSTWDGGAMGHKLGPPSMWLIGRAGGVCRQERSGLRTGWVGGVIVPFSQYVHRQIAASQGWLSAPSDAQLHSTMARSHLSVCMCRPSIHAMSTPRLPLVTGSNPTAHAFCPGPTQGGGKGWWGEGRGEGLQLTIAGSQPSTSRALS